MKLFRLTLFLGIFTLGCTLTVEAQKFSIPNPSEFKSDMLGALAPGDDLGLSDKQKNDLKKENQGFLNDVVNIASGNKSDSDKLIDIKSLTGKKNSGLGDILGSDDMVKKYRKKVKKQIRPYKRKYKLAKLVL